MVVLELHGIACLEASTPNEALDIVAGSLAIADSDAGSSATRVFTLTPSTHGNPEGVASAGRGE